MKCKDKMYRIITLPDLCTEAKNDEDDVRPNNVTDDADGKNVNLELPDSGDTKMNV